MDQLWQRFEAISNNNLKGSCKERIKNREKYEKDKRKCCSGRGRTPARRNVLKAPSRKILKPQVDISLVEGGGARAFT